MFAGMGNSFSEKTAMAVKSTKSVKSSAKSARAAARPAKPPSSKLRAFLRERILGRVADLGVSQKRAGEMMGLTQQQVSRLTAGEDVFSFDRLVDAAAGIDLEVHVKAARPSRGA